MDEMVFAEDLAVGSGSPPPLRTGEIVDHLDAG